MSFLLDTNIVSEMRKPSAHRNVKAWTSTVDASDLYLSVLVIGEIRMGIERLQQRDAKQAQVYDIWLRTLLRDYADRLLPLTTDIAEEWGRMNVPDPLPVIDGLLAATAKVHRLTLVTRNIRDLTRTGVRLLNPFD